MEYITQLWNYFKVNILGMAPETKKVHKRCFIPDLLY